MRLSTGMGVAVLALLFCISVKAGSIPIEQFAKAPLFSRLRMSPDGEYIAFLHEEEGKELLYLSDLGRKKRPAQIDPGAAAYSAIRKEISDYLWISDNRVAFTTTFWDVYWSGVSAVDRDGKHWKALSGWDADPRGIRPLMAQEIIHSFGDSEAHVLMLDRRDTTGGKILYPHVIKVNTLTGSYEQEVENPGNVISWAADREGVVRLGITSEGVHFGAIYRDNAKAPWRPLFTPSARDRQISPLGFDHSNQKLFVSALSEKKRGAVFLLQPGQEDLGEPILEDPEFDVIPTGDLVPAVDGIPMYGLIFSRRKQALVGIRYLTTGPVVKWLDDEFARYQDAIDRALPGMVNVITSRTKDDSKMMVLSFSDTEPGTYHLFDVPSRSLHFVGARMPWIKPDEMAPMNLIKYPARDGLTIYGYLTVPLGHKAKDLPLIVMPHGGPWVRDVWAFDETVQFLANRGYAVLQMNYRGSIGYGQELGVKGKREVGRGIQNDIEDATRWAIAKHIADPKRIAIMGTSYGGYSTLFALGKTPELYRCGISIAGVTDWPGIMKGKTDEEYRLAYQHWVEQIGNPKEDQEFLRSISPVNFADEIVAPVFIIQGKEDRVVPPKQARIMIAALEKAGRKPEKLFLGNDGHGLTTEKGRIESFKRVEAFLHKHLGPGVTPIMPPTVASAVEEKK